VSACSECAAGFFQPSAGQSMCTECDSCPAGARQACGGPAEGYCSDCIPGKYADVSTSSCVVCSSGKYQAGTNAASCEVCQAGDYQGSNGQSFCLPCQAGSITDTGSAAGATTCIACAAGEYSSDPGVASCIACAVGSVTNMGSEPGASACTKCAVGTFSEASAMSACSECAAGFFQPSAGQSMCADCDSCPAGARQACGGSAEGYCSDCIPGKYADTVASPCKACPTGRYQMGTN
jgi:hypothetical protein